MSTSKESILQVVEIIKIKKQRGEKTQHIIKYLIHKGHCFHTIFTAMDKYSKIR